MRPIWEWTDHSILLFFVANAAWLGSRMEGDRDKAAGREASLWSVCAMVIWIATEVWFFTAVT